jgi:hypothetical protein
MIFAAVAAFLGWVMKLVFFVKLGLVSLQRTFVGKSGGVPAKRTSVRNVTKWI